MKRREFLQKTAAAAGFLTLPSLLDQLHVMAQANASPEEIRTGPGVLPKRRYGKTDEFLSIIGFGGIVVRDVTPQEAERYVAEAFERGVNYFDVAPSYGNAQERMGPALEPYRKKVFLSCKTMQRDYEGAKRELEESLELLKTDHFDLYQLHAIQDAEKDVARAFADDGAMRLLMEARKDGRARYLGFSAHSHAAALEAMRRYDFDSVMLPVNYVSYLEGNFSEEVIAAAKEKGMAVLALKILARQRVGKDHPARQQYPKCWYEPITDPEEAKASMSFTLSQPAVTTALPPGHYELFKLALDLAPEAGPMSEERIEKLKAMAATMKPIFVNPS